MKNFITKTVPEQVIQEHEEKQFISLTCDLCGKEIKANGIFDMSKTSVVIEEGVSYPEGGGNCERTEFDVCVKCFKNKVMPWFINRGAQPRVKEIDW